MKASLSLAALLPALTQGIRIVQSNDDGWAELYARSFNDALIASGHQVILSGPAENKSGSSSLDEAPKPRTEPCHFNSCPANSPATGFNATRPDLNWVNSFPVSAMKHGIKTVAPKLWNGAKPELAVSGPNVGSNIWLAVPFSGTVGTVCYASHTEGIPGIAFSGVDEGNVAWNTRPEPIRSLVYAELATDLTNAVIASGKPYLPKDTFLNVNFPKITPECQDSAKFKWVFTRINPGVISAPDVNHCGKTRLPTEFDIHFKTGGCFASISVGDSVDKTTASVEKQTIVLNKLKSMISCV